MEIKCENCSFSHEIGETFRKKFNCDPMLECRKSPPSAFKENGNRYKIEYWDFPKVAPNFWCGEFVEKILFVKQDEKRCDNCKHVDNEGDEEPCLSCDFCEKNWEPDDNE